MVGMWLPPDIMDRTEKTPSHYRVRNCMSAQVDTVVLHQTSCARGFAPGSYLTVHAHDVVLPKRHTTPLCNSIQSTRISLLRAVSTTMPYRSRSSEKFPINAAFMGSRTSMGAACFLHSRSMVAAIS
jgi:hypothetical protein